MIGEYSQTKLPRQCMTIFNYVNVTDQTIATIIEIIKGHSMHTIIVAGLSVQLQSSKLIRCNMKSLKQLQQLSLISVILLVLYIQKGIVYHYA